jgi:6-phosphogluconolactonase (cycloisomerase 2 family)
MRNLGCASGLAAAGVAAICGQAAGQASQRAAFVANNGNIEGSVTSYAFGPGGEPVFVAKHITGSGSSNPGNNAYAITLSPNGRYLAVTHATSATVFERLDILRVNADATLTPVGAFSTPDSPLAAAWVSDTLLSVTLTNLSQPNKVIMYRFDPAAATLVEIDRKDSGGFTGYLAVHPSGQYLYAQDSPLGSGNYTLAAFRVEADGTLTNVGTFPTSPNYALGPGITADGRRLYAGGGAINGNNKIVGFDISPTGLLSPIEGSPWTSPGSGPSPKQAAPTPDGRYLFVGHGTSSQVRSFAIDSGGGLTDTGNAFTVGIQGDLGGVAVLGPWVLFTRKYSTGGPTGLFSFTVQTDGSFTANGPVVSSQGSLPQFIAPWDPPGAACYANCDGSTAAPVLNVLDFTCFLNKFAAGEPYANCDGSTVAPVLNVLDFTCFLNRFGEGCE